MARAGEIVGLDKLLIKLKQLEPKIHKKALFPALNVAADVILRQARSNLGKTKRLKHNIEKFRIRVKIARFRFKNTQSIGVGIPGGRHDAFYGLFLELGTKLRKTKTGASKGTMTKRPWLRPAFDTSADRARRVFGDKLGRKIEQLAKI